MSGYQSQVPAVVRQCPECGETTVDGRFPVVRWRGQRWHLSCAEACGRVPPLPGDHDGYYFGAAGTPRSAR